MNLPENMGRDVRFHLVEPLSIHSPLAKETHKCFVWKTARMSNACYQNLRESLLRRVKDTGTMVGNGHVMGK
jgi:hypothetical protein